MHGQQNIKKNKKMEIYQKIIPFVKGKHLSDLVFFLSGDSPASGFLSADVSEHSVPSSYAV